MKIMRSWLSWTPAIGAVVVVSAAAIAVPIAANASAPLPTKSTAQIIAMVASSKVTAFSGTIEQTSDLGLPTLPTVGSGSDSSATSALELVTGSHTAMVYVDGATRERIQVLDSLAERDVIRSGSSVWIYDSKKHTAQHATVSAHQRGIPEKRMPSATPSELAAKLLGTLAPTSNVTVGPQLTVAHHSAYNLLLTPKAADSLLGSISIAVDSATGLPLQVQLNARGETRAAVSVGFSDISISRPTASVFRFTPPSHTTVTQLNAKSHHAGKSGPHSKALPGKKAASDGSKTANARPTTKVTGKGWDAVLTVSSASQLKQLTASPLWNELTTAVADGRVFHTTLLNVLVTSDGRILAGSVSVERLQAVADAS